MPANQGVVVAALLSWGVCVVVSTWVMLAHLQAQRNAQTQVLQQQALLAALSEVDLALMRHADALSSGDSVPMVPRHHLREFQDRLLSPTLLPLPAPHAAATLDAMQQGRFSAMAEGPLATWLQINQALEEDFRTSSEQTARAAILAQVWLVIGGVAALFFGSLGVGLLAFHRWAIPLVSLRARIHALAARRADGLALRRNTPAQAAAAPVPDDSLQRIAHLLEEGERRIADFAKQLAAQKSSRQWLALAREIPGVFFQYTYLADGSSVCRFISPQAHDFFHPAHPDDHSPAPAHARLGSESVPPALSCNLGRRLAEMAGLQATLTFDTEIGTGEDKRWIRTLANLLPDAGDRQLVSGVWLDVTDALDKDAALAEARNFAEQQAREKSRLLAVMSHEIRTPLNGVLGMTQLALKGEVTEQLRLRLEKAQQAGMQLMTIVNDVLDYSKMESGQLEPEQAPFDLYELLAQCADLLSPRAAEKGLELWLDVPTDIPRWIIGDAGRTRQILTNYLSNAVKFTPAGHICVKVRLCTGSAMATDGNAPPTIRFEVHDTGIGVSAAQQGQLFAAFHQADASITRRYGGTGLGLFISAELARLLGGRTGMRSQLHTGSEFWLELPLHAARAPVAPPCAKWLMHKRVVVVESHASVRACLAQLLRNRFQCSVTEFADGAACIAALTQREHAGHGWPDLVVCAHALADMEVLQLLAALTPCPAFADVTVWVGAWPLPGDVARGLTRAGVDRILEKPLCMATLERAAQQQAHACRSVAQNMVGHTVVDPSRKPTAPAVAARAQPLRLLVVDDNALNRAITAELTQAQPGLVADIDFAEDGEQALRAVHQAPYIYTAIFMDLQMPTLDGYSATREIRKLPGYALVPIFALSAHRGEPERAAAFAAGMSDFIHKPVVEQTLRDVLTRHHLIGPGQPETRTPQPLAQQAPQRIAQQAAPRPNVHRSANVASATSEELLDLVAWRDLLASLSPQRVRALAHAFTQQCHALPATSQQALVHGHTTSALAALHNLSGTAGTFGLTALGRKAAVLEESLIASAEHADVATLFAELHTCSQASLAALALQMHRDLRP